MKIWEVAQEWHVPLYHGTSLVEFERLKANGYNARDIYLGDNMENITDHYAEQKAEEHDSYPVTLIVDGSKLENVQPDYDEFGQIQLGQWVYTGPLRQALKGAILFDEEGEEQRLPL